MKLLRLSALILVTLLLASCESLVSTDDINPDRIEATYDLHYEGGRDITFATVNFYVGNERLKLGEGSITFNGDELIEKAAQGNFYEMEYKGEVSSGTFVWTDANGRTYRNRVQLPERISVPQGLPAVDNDSSYSFSWDGEPILNGETIWFSAFRLEITDNDLIFRELKNAGSREVLTGADAWRNISPGNVTFVLERRRSSDVDEGTSAGGEIFERYTSEGVTVAVQD